MPTIDPIESPCVRNCCLNEQDICVGCYRSLDEITHWSQASNSDKQAILNNVAKRKQACKFNFGGSASIE